MDERKEKCKYHCPIEVPEASESLSLWVGPLTVAIFFVMRRIGGYVLHDAALPYATLISEEEHLVHLILIIFSQCLIFNSESSPELLKLFLLNLRCCTKILELLL